MNHSQMIMCQTFACHPVVTSKFPLAVPHNIQCRTPCTPLNVILTKLFRPTPHTETMCSHTLKHSKAWYDIHCIVLSGTLIIDCIHTEGSRYCRLPFPKVIYTDYTCIYTLRTFQINTPSKCAIKSDLSRTHCSTYRIFILKTIGEACYRISILIKCIGSIPESMDLIRARCVLMALKGWFIFRGPVFWYPRDSVLCDRKWKMVWSVTLPELQYSYEGVGSFLKLLMRKSSNVSELISD